MQKRNAGMTVQPSAIMVCNGIDAILFSGTVQRIKRYAWFSAEKCNKFRGMNRTPKSRVMFFYPLEYISRGVL